MCCSSFFVTLAACVCRYLLPSRLPGDAHTSSRAASAAPLGPARDAISLIPYPRWDVEARRAGRPALGARFGGWLPGVAQFDAGLFGVSAPEAQLMDPQAAPASGGARPCKTL